MRNNLNSTTEIVTTTFFRQHVGIDTTSGEIVTTRHGRANETLIMSEVEVGFRAVIGHEDLTVLERAHGTRINVDVRIKLEHSDLKATGFQNGSQRCRSDAFPQRRNNTTRDKDKTCHRRSASRDEKFVTERASFH